MAYKKYYFLATLGTASRKYNNNCFESFFLRKPIIGLQRKKDSKRI